MTSNSERCPNDGTPTTAYNDYLCPTCHVKWAHNTLDVGSLFWGFVIGAVAGGWVVWTQSGRATARAAAQKGYAFGRQVAGEAYTRGREELKRRGY